jgi:hypothetical protein
MISDAVCLIVGTRMVTVAPCRVSCSKGQETYNAAYVLDGSIGNRRR